MAKVNFKIVILWDKTKNIMQHRILMRFLFSEMVLNKIHVLFSRLSYHC